MIRPLHDFPPGGLFCLLRYYAKVPLFGRKILECQKIHEQGRPTINHNTGIISSLLVSHPFPSTLHTGPCLSERSEHFWQIVLRGVKTEQNWT